VKVNALPGADPLDPPMGILVQRGTNIKFLHSELTNLDTALSVEKSNSLIIADNHFHDLRSDAADISDSNNITITGNFVHDLYIVGGDHPDAFQFWTTATQTMPCSNVVITGNAIWKGTRSDAADLQGTFFNNDGGPWNNVTIQDNFYGCTGYSGITLMGGLAPLVPGSAANNVTIHQNELWGDATQETRIRLEHVNVATVTDNKAQNFLFDVDDANLTLSNNVVSPNVTDGAYSALVAWFNRHPSMAWAATKLPNQATPQFPDEAARYSGRLPESGVAGVSQYVGADPATATKTMEKDGLPPGWAYRGDVDTIYPTQDDAVLMDYNIRGHQIHIDGTYKNPHLENIIGFVGQDGNFTPPMRIGGLGGGTVRRITLDGNRQAMSWFDALINVGSINGTWVFDQIALLSSFDDGFQFATNNGEVDLTMTNIVVSNNGWGLMTGGHPDALQFFGSTLIGLTIRNFSHIMNVDSDQYGTQGMFLNDGGDLADLSHAARFSKIDIDGFYQLYPIPARVNYGLRIDTTGVRDYVTVKNLYFDPTGSIAPVQVDANHKTFPAVTPQISGVNLLTGQAVTF
jgi:hypothetical protein